MKYILLVMLIVNNGHCYSQASSTVEKIIFIRHGEKGESGDNLSCQGLNRSLLLAPVLHMKFGSVNHIFVPTLNEGKSTTHSRMFQTITPYAVRENLPISTKFDESDYSGVAKALAKQNGTVLVVWEHKNIRKIVKALGIKEDLRWDDSDFDSIWIVTYLKGAPLLTREKEGLNPGTNCN